MVLSASLHLWAVMFCYRLDLIALIGFAEVHRRVLRAKHEYNIENQLLNEEMVVGSKGLVYSSAKEVSVEILVILSQGPHKNCILLFGFTY